MGGIPLTFDDVKEAAVRIAPHVCRTPLMTSASLDAAAGGNVFFKCENFQHAGAFKARGAVNAVFSLDAKTAANGVATHSSGNHGAALARAAALRGIPCHVVVPKGANPVKRSAIVRYGANVIECPPTMQGREDALADVAERTGAHIVHPYADYAVMAGQGTVALEVFDEVAPDLLVVPLGGGGLISGSATVAKAVSPKTQVIGVEPAGAADALASFRAGKVRPVDNPRTIADGLRATVGAMNLAIIREKVDDIVTVTDAEIVTAMRLVWERLKIVIEPSAAVGLAAVLNHAVDLRGRRAAIILTGGNADLDNLPWPDREKSE
ncbi:MAG TPA: pyridoxal-phosphate dependent enzyme [Gammaproteobacteria bacterium]